MLNSAVKYLSKQGLLYIGEKRIFANTVEYNISLTSTVGWSRVNDLFALAEPSESFSGGNVNGVFLQTGIPKSKTETK